MAAEGKGHDSVSWGFYGLIFGPFAMLAACALPDLKTRKILRSIAESQGVKFDFEDDQISNSSLPSRITSSDSSITQESDGTSEGDYSACLVLFKLKGGKGDPVYENTFRDNKFLRLVDNKGVWLANFEKTNTGAWRIINIKDKDDLLWGLEV